MFPTSGAPRPGFVGPRHELRERLLLDLFLAAGPGPKILNVGAGQGSFTQLLEARGYDVVSSDVSPSAVAVLESRVHGDVLQADLTDLPLPDDAFDGVVAGEVLEHIEAEGQALSEAASSAPTRRRPCALGSRPSRVVRRERPVGGPRSSLHARHTDGRDRRCRIRTRGNTTLGIPDVRLLPPCDL